MVFPILGVHELRTEKILSKNYKNKERRRQTSTHLAHAGGKIHDTSMSVSFEEDPVIKQRPPSRVVTNCFNELGKSYWEVIHTLVEIHD
jgi:hypothetical protein